MTKAWEVKMEEQIIEVFKETDIVKRVARIVYNEPHKSRRDDLIKIAVLDRILEAFSEEIKLCGLRRWITHVYKHRLLPDKN